MHVGPITLAWRVGARVLAEQPRGLYCPGLYCLGCTAQKTLANMSHCVQVLHVLSCILVGGHTVPEFMYKALEYLLVRMRARQFTAIDVAQTAHIIGTWRAGPERRGSKRPAVMELVNEIERASIELMQIGEMTSRQLANVLWMFGRLQQQPSQFLFSQLASRMLTERVRVLTMLHGVLGASWHAGNADLSGHNITSSPQYRLECHAFQPLLSSMSL